MTLSDVVPEFVDPPAPPASCGPRPLRWGAWIPAVALLPFAPKRIGVRLSAASWPVAILAFMACAVLAVLIAGHIGSHFYDPTAGIMFALSGVNPPQPSVDPHDDLGLVSRAQNVVTSALNTIYLTTASFGDIYAVWGVMLASCFLCLLLGVLALPYIATGERLGRLLSRSLKLSLFSSVMLVVAAMGAAAITYIGLRFPSQFEYLEWTPTFITMSVIAAAWWFNVIVRMGRLYAGPPDGPAWQPVRPRCLACGYVLTGLPRDGDCPECGLTIADSLSENRTTSAWVAARKLLDQPSGWLRTSLAVFRDPNFFRRLDVTGGTSKAIDFAGLSSAFPAAVFAAGGILAGIFVTDSSHAAIWLRIALAAFFGLAAFCGVRLVFFGLLSLIGLLVGYRRGVDPRAVTVAVCYSSARLLPAWAVLIAIVLLQDVVRRAAAAFPQFPVSIGMLLMLIPVLLVLRAALQIRKSVREVVGAASR